MYVKSKRKVTKHGGNLCILSVVSITSLCLAGGEEAKAVIRNRLGGLANQAVSMLRSIGGGVNNGISRARSVGTVVTSGGGFGSSTSGLKVRQTVGGGGSKVRTLVSFFEQKAGENSGKVKVFTQEPSSAMEKLTWKPGTYGVQDYTGSDETNKRLMYKTSSSDQNTLESSTGKRYISRMNLLVVKEGDRIRIVEQGKPVFKNSSFNSQMQKVASNSAVRQFASKFKVSTTGSTDTDTSTTSTPTTSTPTTSSLSVVSDVKLSQSKPTPTSSRNVSKLKTSTETTASSSETSTAPVTTETQNSIKGVSQAVGSFGGYDEDSDTDLQRAILESLQTSRATTSTTVPTSSTVFTSPGGGFARFNRKLENPFTEAYLKSIGRFETESNKTGTTTTSTTTATSTATSSSSTSRGGSRRSSTS